jgi:hypothetical protein
MKRSPYPALVGKLLHAAARVQVARWDSAIRRVEETQERTLAKILKRAKDTEYGRRHGFDRIRDHADFARKIPLGDYDSFSSYVDRMRKGEANVLVPERLRYFGNSSGSSNHGKPKFLPIGEAQIVEQRRSGADALMRYLVSHHDVDLPSGFTIGLFPPITMKEDGPSFITTNPALMTTRMPLFTRPMYLPDAELMRMSDYDRKLTLIAERYRDHDVRAISGTTCWFSLLFEKVLAVSKKSSVDQVWPNLRVLFGGGVSAAPYLPILQRLVGRDIALVDTYNATEGGIYGASDFSGERGLLMLPHRGTFFEFVPLEDHGKANARRIPLWAVEKDKPYVIVVTTLSGLYAYEIGDIVRFATTDPPRIEFMGRLSGCLSLTQELTTHVEIERAVELAIAKCPCRIVDFGAAGDVGGAKPGYVLYAEFDEEPSSVEAFARAFDDGLRIENRVYREHRERDVALLAPRVEPLVRGGAKKFLDEVTGGNVQGKFPRILDDARKGRVAAYTRSSVGERI